MAVLPTGIGPVTGYQIERSLRFNSADSAYLNRTFGSAPTNDDKATISLWVKRTNPGAENQLYSARASGAAAYTSLRFDSTDELDFLMVNSSSTVIARLVTTAKYRDPSAWYHIVFAYDSTDATSSNRLKLYVNGVQVTVFNTATYPAQNTDLALWAKNTVVNYISREGDGYSSYLNGYLTEVNFIDGQALTPSSFGETDTNTGVWKPKAYSGTYGTNGFYLKFADNSGTTSTTLGKDSSGNANNWTPNNFSVTAGAGNDSLVDTPTNYGTDTGAGGEVRGNYCTYNSTEDAATQGTRGGGGGGTLSNGNLQLYRAAGANSCISGTVSVSSGKWYWEITGDAAGNGWSCGVRLANSYASDENYWVGYSAGKSNEWGYIGSTGNKANGTTGTSYGNTFGANTIGVALDLDNGKIWFSKDGTWQASGDPAAGTNAAFTNVSGTVMPRVSANGQNLNANFGQRAFAYTAPSGFKALCTQNLPTPTIGATSTTQAGKYMNAVLYTGTGATRSVTGVGFQPDFVWNKCRSAARGHALYDVIRGATKGLASNTTGAEYTESGLTSFDSDGFSLGSASTDNNLNDTFVAWNWKANGAGSSNTAGTITSTVSANTTSGFSIVTYTGTGANATVGHGLGVAPKLVIVKIRSTTGYWTVQHSALGSGYYGYLNFTNSFDTANANLRWNSTNPSSTVFSIGTASDVNTNTATYVAYCFAPVAGYSAFGSYEANNSSDGVFVYLGFRPKWVMFKRSSTGTNSWVIIDAARNTYNVSDNALYPNQSYAENGTIGTEPVDFTSNGFKIRTSNSEVNGTGTYIYAAFAESPFKYSLAR